MPPKHVIRFCSVRGRAGRNSIIISGTEAKYSLPYLIYDIPPEQKTCLEAFCGWRAEPENVGNILEFLYIK